MTFAWRMGRGTSKAFICHSVAFVPRLLSRTLLLAGLLGGPLGPHGLGIAAQAAGQSPPGISPEPRFRWRAGELQLPGCQADRDGGRRLRHAPPALEELDAHLRLNLASYKLPRGYEIVAMLPRDEAGKIWRSKWPPPASVPVWDLVHTDDHAWRAQLCGF